MLGVLLEMSLAYMKEIRESVEEALPLKDMITVMFTNLLIKKHE